MKEEVINILTKRKKKEAKKKEKKNYYYCKLLAGQDNGEMYKDYYSH